MQVAIVLDAGHAQPLHARAVDSPLPGNQLLEREIVAFASLIKSEQPALDRGDQFGLAPTDPAPGSWRPERFARQRSAKGPVQLASRLFGFSSMSTTSYH